MHKNSSNYRFVGPGLRWWLMAGWLLCLFPLLSLVAWPRAQRESLTPEEIELVREHQELDKRTGIFIKAIERRMLVITPSSSPPLASAKQAQKDAEKMGPLPESTRAQLLSDVAKILDEAITNIDDAAVHNDKSALIPKALSKLVEATQRFHPQLVALRSVMPDEVPEREWLERAIEHATSILEAARKLPAETKK